MIGFALFVALQNAVPALVPPPPAAAPVVVTTSSGLRFQVLQPGTGRRPVAGDAVLVTYEGRLANGSVFDSAEEPVGFAVSDLVLGFTEALLMMNQGGRYRFWIPPQLAYGAEGSGGAVPPNAELDFTVTLVAVGHAAPP
jgi:FKBP-type peptidyl-prolyl cis-trans isomerase